MLVYRENKIKRTTKNLEKSQQNNKPYHKSFWLNIADLPKDCEDVRIQGYKSGEFMIWPTTDVTPYMVYCDMELVPGHGRSLYRT